MDYLFDFLFLENIVFFWDCLGFHKLTKMLSYNNLMKIIITKTEQEGVFRLSFKYENFQDFEYLFSIEKPSMGKKNMTIEKLLKTSFLFKKNTLDEILIRIKTKDNSQTFISRGVVDQSVILDLEKNDVVCMDIF